MALDREDIEAIAAQVVTLLEHRDAGGAVVGDSPSGFLDAATVARELRVERDWVYAHANRLGAVRLGGPRGRLRFDMRVVKERLSGAEAASWRAPRRPARRPPGRKLARKPPRGGVKSLPITAKSGRGAR